MRSYFKNWTLLAANLAVVGTSALGASALNAAEWTLTPRVQIQTGHDSNLRLTNGNEDGAIDSNVQGSLIAKRRTETSDISLTGGYNVVKYDNAAPNIRDRDQQFAQAIFRKKWTRWASGASIGLRRDDLLRIINEGGIDNGGELGSGAGIAPLPEDTPLDELSPEDDAAEQFESAEQVRRTLWRGALYGQYELTERDRLRLTYGYADRDYETGNLISNLRDSKRHSIDLQYARDLSAQTVLAFNVSAAELETTNRPDANFYQGLVTWRNRFSETGRLEIGAGISQVDSDIESSTGFLARIRGSAVLANGKVAAELKRALTPNAFGNVVETDIAKFRYNRSLSERIDLNFDLTAQRRERGTDDDRSERDQVRASLTTSWNFASEWSIGATYGFAWINRKDDQIANPGKSEGHRGALLLTWQPKIIRIGQ